MSRKNRKPAKLTLRPESLAWLTQRCTDTEFTRVIALYDRGQIEALLCYLKAITTPEVFAEFEEANLPPEVLAARRKAEAERIEKLEAERRTIKNGDVPVNPADIVAGRGGWKLASHLTAAERATAEKVAEEERTGMVELPPEEF